MLSPSQAAAMSDEEFDDEVKKANQLYVNGDSAKCFAFLKQLEIKSRKAGARNHVRLLVYMMRMSYELGLETEAGRIGEQINSAISKIKDEQYLKNMHMAMAAVYANSSRLKQARDEIKKSLGYGEAVENLFTYAMITAKFGEREEAYKIIDKIFKLNSKNGKKSEETIMNNMTAAIIALSFEDFTRARENIDVVMKALAEVSDSGYFVYIYKSLLNNIFSFFEYNPLNLGYYEKMHKMAMERGNKEDAGAICVKTARVLSDLGLYKQAVLRLDEAAVLLKLNAIKLDDEAGIRDLSYETLGQIYQIAKVFMDCAHYDAAAKLLEDLVFIYEKKGNLKDSFEKIRDLARCKFNQNSPLWRNLADELVKTCAEINETRELMLTKNFMGERYLETGEIEQARKIFKELETELEKVKKDDLAQSELSELYFRVGCNLASLELKKNKTDEALKTVDAYLGVYEFYKTQKKSIKNKKRKSGDSLTNFTVVVEFSVSDIAEAAGRLYLMKARLLFERKRYDESYDMALTAFDLLKNTDYAKNFYELLSFVISNEDRFKDKKSYGRFKEIRAKYEEIIKSAREAGTVTEKK